MATCSVVVMSPGYDTEWRYSPVRVFTGDGHRERAERFAAEKNRQEKDKRAGCYRDDYKVNSADLDEES